MDITWEEFAAVLPQLDTETQLRITNMVLVQRLRKADEELARRNAAIAQLEADLRSPDPKTNGEAVSV